MLKNIGWYVFWIFWGGGIAIWSPNFLSNVSTIPLNCPITLYQSQHRISKIWGGELTSYHLGIPLLSLLTALSPPPFQYFWSAICPRGLTGFGVGRWLLRRILRTFLGLGGSKVIRREVAKRCQNKEQGETEGEHFVRKEHNRVLETTCWTGIEDWLVDCIRGYHYLSEQQAIERNTIQDTRIIP